MDRPIDREFGILRDAIRRAASDSQGQVSPTRHEKWTLTTAPSWRYMTTLRSSRRMTRPHASQRKRRAKRTFASMTLSDATSTYDSPRARRCATIIVCFADDAEGSSGF